MVVRQGEIVWRNWGFIINMAKWFIDSITCWSGRFGDFKLLRFIDCI